MSYRPRLKNKEEFEEFQEFRKHKALAEECEEKGIPLDSVNYYWYKSQKFSINASNKQDSLPEVKDQMIKEMKKHSPKYPKIKYPKIKQDPCLLEISIYDLHFGKLCWNGETGEDYDTKIAEERFLNAINSHIQRAKGFNIERILFPVGNDFFNSDNRHNTTSNNTPQDEDLRWQKTYKKGRELLIKGIDLLQQIAPVDIISVPGNHDFERTFYVSDALQCWYNRCPNVTVNNDASPRKYYEYGDCLIGFTHGNNEKVSDLPLLMAMESKELWSKTKFREWHLGHLHHLKKREFETVKENKGVVVRFMRSLSGTDAWHNLKSYKGSLQSSESFIWKKDEGMICQMTHTITL